MNKFVQILVSSIVMCAIYFGASFLINSLTGTKCASCDKTITGKGIRVVGSDTVYCSEWCAGTWRNR